MYWVGLKPDLPRAINNDGQARYLSTAPGVATSSHDPTALLQRDCTFPEVDAESLAAKKIEAQQAVDAGARR
jgi:hypothetical protein